MKTLLATLLVVATTLVALPANADNRHGRGWDRHHDHGYHGRDRYRSRNHYYGNSYYGNTYYSFGSNWYSGYGYPYGHRGNSVSISIGSRHRHHDSFSTGSFLGGLVVGSVLSAPRHYDDYTYRQPVVQRSSVTVINRSPVISQPAGRRLLRDLQGRCFEISTDSRGNETRVELAPSSCNF